MSFLRGTSSIRNKRLRPNTSTTAVRLTKRQMKVLERNLNTRVSKFPSLTLYTFADFNKAERLDAAHSYQFNAISVELLVRINRNGATHALTVRCNVPNRHAIQAYTA